MNEKINSKIKKLNNSSFIILIFGILKFWNICRSTFGHLVVPNVDPNPWNYNRIKHLVRNASLKVLYVNSIILITKSPFFNFQMFKLNAKSSFFIVTNYYQGKSRYLDKSSEACKSHTSSNFSVSFYSLLTPLREFSLIWTLPKCIFENGWQSERGLI